jgi:uncharacterized protein (TIGR03032 family)
LSKSSDQEPAKKFELYTSKGFNKWLLDSGGSLVFSTYQVGKVLFVGSQPDGKLSLFERSFPRAMGIGISDDTQSFLLATQSQIYSFDNLLAPGQKADQYDALYSPHVSWITGDVDAHDIEIGADGLPIFVNTLFNCIATVSPNHSFKPVWKPSFISQLVAEDRCHLNGMATENGVPKYVTCVSRSDVADGWRDRRIDGGVVVDVATNEVVVEGLSMPHSPRLHDGKLWMLNSGKGELGWVDPSKGEFNPIAFCPGFARGLTIIGNHAVVGLSEPRTKKTFDDLPLQSLLEEKDTKPRCGLMVIDLKTGSTVEWVRIEGVIAELFDVGFLSGVKAPCANGIVGPEIQQMISVAP